MSYHKKEKQLDMLRQVYEAGLHLLSPTTTEELYPRVTETLKILVSSAFISIYRVQNDELVKVYTSSSELSNIYPRKLGFTYKSFKEAIPYLINKKNVRTIHPELKSIGVETTLVIPLIFELEPIGVLSLDFSEEQEFSPHIIDALQLFASIITFKIKNIDLESQLREMVENQKMFISLASHELKNPLTTVLGYSTIIARKTRKGDTIDLKIINNLVSEIHRMAQLIDELLNTKNGNIEKGKLKYNKRSYSFKKLVKNTIISWKISYPKRKIHFQENLEKDIVYIDPQKVKQVFINLLNNAAKFSSDETDITINVKNDQNWIICSVIDEGKGIAKKDLAQIFKRFYKGNYGKKKDGMGLGLYLCKQIIEDHGGTILAYSQQGKGSKLEIQLPLYE
jgi:signal transduction histidine kinase